MKTIITALRASDASGYLRRGSAELREQTEQGPYSPAVANRHSASTLIDALLVRALAGRRLCCAVSPNGMSAHPDGGRLAVSRGQTRTGPHRSVNAVTRFGASCRNRFHIPVAQVLSSERINQSIVPD
jgi:hypothetical protein